MSDEVDEATRAQIAECLRMTPDERLQSLENAVELIQRAREAMRAAMKKTASER